MLSNLLDNAIEAAEKCEKPEIIVTIGENKAYLVFIVTNSVLQSVMTNNPDMLSTKNDPEHHGFGILNMQDIVGKYDGMLDFSEQNGKFTASAYLKKH